MAIKQRLAQILLITDTYRFCVTALGNTKNQVYFTVGIFSTYILAMFCYEKCMLHLKQILPAQEIVFLI